MTKKLGAAAIIMGSVMIFPALGQQNAQPVSPPQGLAATYVGSTACKTCHSAKYESWSKTRMANLVTDPKVHPEVILPDLTKPDPLVTFRLEDIARVYGTKWKQRYFQKVGDDYFRLRGQCDVSNQVWRAYNIATVAD